MASDITIGSITIPVTTLVEGSIWTVDVHDILEAKDRDWVDSVHRVASQAEEVKFKGGAVETSMEEEDFETVYRPTNGNQIKQHLPWLVDVYKNEFSEIISTLIQDQSLELGSDLEHSLNMNYTVGKGRKYELHRDRNPWTFLLGACSWKEEYGGKTCIYDKNSEKDLLAAVSPQTGIGVVFNGHHPHRVTEIQTDLPRLVIPGDYYTSEHPEHIDTEFNKKILKST